MSEEDRTLIPPGVYSALLIASADGTLRPFEITRAWSGVRTQGAFGEPEHACGDLAAGIAAPSSDAVPLTVLPPATMGPNVAANPSGASDGGPLSSEEASTLQERHQRTSMLRSLSPLNPLARSPSPALSHSSTASPSLKSGTVFQSNCGLTIHKDVRPFRAGNGNSGFTVWYHTSVARKMSAPPAFQEALVPGAVFLLRHPNQGISQAWVRQLDNVWAAVDLRGAEEIQHPSIHDRVLVIRSDGWPSWIRRQSLRTYHCKSRRDEARAEV